MIDGVRPLGVRAIFLLGSCLLIGQVLAAAEAKATAEKTTLVLIVGAPGEPTYAKIFADELAQWRNTAHVCGLDLRVIGEPVEDEPPGTDKEKLQQLLAKELKRDTPGAPLWLVFVGHGTFDGRTAAFNLRGPDLTNVELALWLKACQRPLVVVDTTAASGPFLTALSAPDRVVITATKSGQERNYTRFGRYFARRVIDPRADLDKDEQTSLLEAFLAASRDTVEFYKNDRRIATEHPLLDDTGDAQGIRAEFFERDVPVKKLSGSQSLDGDLARRFYLRPSDSERSLSSEQRSKRDALEAELAALRRRKAELSDDDYLRELERVLVALSRVYERP